MKKALSLILTLMLLFSVSPMTALAVDTDSAPAAAEVDTADTAAQPDAAESDPSAPLEKGAADLAATGEYDYTDPDNPYLAKDFESLEAVFEEMRPRDITVYIKLAKDIFRTRKGAQLTTNGADVVLDLAGYTLGVTTDETSLIRATNGQVTIEDSRRYDSSKKQWIDGRLEFETKDMDPDSIHFFSYTWLMSGDIVIKGGRFKNNNHSPDRMDSVFSGRSLEMYGGTFEADYPIILSKNKWYFQSCVIHDGTLRVNREIAVLAYEGCILPDHHPVIERCRIENASGNEKVAAFYLNLEKDFAENHTASEAFAIWNSIVYPETYAFIDGTKQPKGNHGILYNGLGALTGPLFRESYVLTPLSFIDHVEITMPEPRPGTQLSYDASVPEGMGYQVESINEGTTWINGVLWRNSQDKFIPSDSVLEPGESYHLRVAIELTDIYAFAFAPQGSLTASINGHEAMITYRADTNKIYVRYDFTCPERTLIDRLDITIPDPGSGDLITYNSTLPDECGFEKAANSFDSDDENWKNAILWQENGKSLRADRSYYFAAGSEYEISIAVNPTREPWFRYAELSDMTVTVNGVPAEIVYSVHCYIISCTFTPTPQVNSVRITIPELKAGNQLQWIASTPAGANYTVNNKSSTFMSGGVMWYKGTQVVTPGKKMEFEAGETYRVSIRIAALNGHRFTGEDMPAFVNGYSAKVGGFYSDTDYIISFTFTLSVLGDVDNNGEVESLDATWIQRRLTLLNVPIDFSSDRADADGSGYVTLMDATYIQRWLADMKSNDDIGKLIS